LILVNVWRLHFEKTNLKKIFLGLEFSAEVYLDLALVNSRRALSSSVAKAGTNQFENQEYWPSGSAAAMPLVTNSQLIPTFRRPGLW
jgi:hypothetical protein